VNVFKDVFSPPLSDTNPKAVICADELISTEPVKDSKLLNCIFAEDVNAFNDVFSPPLSETNPKAVICADELTILLSKEVK